MNLVGEGVALPENTHPTIGVKEFQDAHLEGSAGEVLKRGVGLNPTEIHVGVAKLDSDSDAARLRSWMHGQDLQQPCFGTCAFSPVPLELPGVPGSAAVVQTATAAPAPKPANYRAEFTIGPYLYWVWFSGDASAKTKSSFEAGVARYYQHAKQQS